MTARGIRRALAAAGLAGVLAGGGLAAEAAYWPLKAWIGQRLLERAWTEARSGADARPWGWADIAPVARLSVPRLGVSAVVLSDASGAAMAWGPGHVPGTAAPGMPGLAAIAGHRDTHLAFLAKTRPGDAILLETADGQVHRFTAGEALVVDSRHWRFPASREGAARLALATCWPFGGSGEGPLRFVLFAEGYGAAAAIASTGAGGA